jgi:hypothetical protein
MEPSDEPPRQPIERSWPRSPQPCPDCEVAPGQAHMSYCPEHPGTWRA